MGDFGPLYAKLRADLPKEAFQPQPTLGAVVFFATLSVITAGYWMLLTRDPLWYFALPLGLVMGAAFSTLAFLGHETLHGSVFKSKWMQEIVGHLSFLIFGFTSTIWRVWHNKVHHTQANIPDEDPDSYGTLTRFKKIPWARFQFKTGVGSGHWSSAFFFFYRFTYHSQIVLWLTSKKYPEAFKALNRKQAIMESFVIFSAWITLALVGGWKIAVFGIAIPMAIANFTLMSYIATNHFLRPLVDHYNPIDDSMSVTTLKIIDFFHLNFSHHVEHHYFPSMNWRFTPRVRKSLMRHAADQYLAPSHWKAILWLYKTPRIYADANTLINPYSGKTMDIREVETKLMKATPHPKGWTFLAERKSTL